MKEKKIFEENDDFINKFNAQNRGFKLGHNRFSHMIEDEYLEFLRKDKKVELSREHEYKNERKLKYKLKGVDWRKHGAVTSVKNQANCGSCWAFSSTEAVESAYYIKYNKSVILSPQSLVDCSWEYGNRGCEGGLHSWSFKFIIDYGIVLESDYSYEAKDGVCKMKLDSFLVKLTGHESIPSGDEDYLAKVTETKGPVAVSIDAGKKTFRFYKEGVYYDPECSKTVLNHDVNLVGMGIFPEPNYIIRNSWTADWGDEGFIRFPWNGTNPCGVASDAMLPLL